MNTVDHERYERLKAVCERIAVETDEEKYNALVQEANELLSGKKQSLPEQQAQGKAAAR